MKLLDVTYVALRNVWHSIPQSLRQNRAVDSVRKWFQYQMVPHLSQDAIYHTAYFEMVDETALRSSEIIADSIVQHFHPNRVIDLGCGTGALLMSLRSRGVAGVGLEYSEAALRICRNRQLEVYKFDLEQDQSQDWGEFDVAVSMEVGEHLPDSAADQYVDLICRCSNTIVFSASPPGTGGLDHVNEQPQEYWIEKFTKRDLILDETLTQQWRSAWSKTDMAPWYYNEVLVFEHRE